MPSAFTLPSAAAFFAPLQLERHETLSYVMFHTPKSCVLVKQNIRTQREILTLYPYRLTFDGKKSSGIAVDGYARSKLR